MRQGVFGRERIRRILFVFLAAFFCQIGLHEVYEEGKSERLHANTVQTAAFRRQYVTEEMESYIQKAEDPGRDLGIYWLETKFGYETFPWQISGETFQERENAGREILPINHTELPAAQSGMQWSIFRYRNQKSLAENLCPLQIHGWKSEIMEEKEDMRGRI